MFFLFANWKMAMSLTDVRGFLNDWQEIIASNETCRRKLETTHRLSILPSFPFLPMVLSAFSKTPSITVGAQDCSHASFGAYTGDVSASTIAELGGSYVLIGHSERRRYHGEGPTVLAQKMTEARGANLDPIYCIGESQDDRLAGRTLSVLGTQLDDLETALNHPIPPDCLIAYEPLWAIGTGAVPSTNDIKAVHAFLKNRFPKNPVLYGGSVTASNAGTLSAIPGVDGLLVGGASTTAHTLFDIIGAL